MDTGYKRHGPPIMMNTWHWLRTLILATYSKSLICGAIAYTSWVVSLNLLPVSYNLVGQPVWSLY